MGLSSVAITQITKSKAGLNKDIALQDIEEAGIVGFTADGDWGINKTKEKGISRIGPLKVNFDSKF